MLLNNNNSGEIVSNNVGEARRFGLAVNAKTFKIISDSLYSDKHGSIVRELCCNAYDAHVAAGCPDRPFDLHLPNRWNDEFRIRDYGIGLSESDLLNVYSNYFMSTKDTSNDFIGAFGLGSKTPFSYTDSFAINSFFNGKKYAYAAMIGADGVPLLVKMADAEDTTEPNGLEIYFSTKNDFGMWANAVAEQLAFFNVKPNIIGNVEWPERSMVKMAEDFWTTDSECFIVVGQVGYRVNHYELKNYLSEDENDFLSLYTGFVIKLPVGAVEVTPSRETISYSKTTIDSLRVFVARTKTELFDTFVKNFNALKTLKEQYEYIKGMHNIKKLMKVTGVSFMEPDVFINYNGDIYFSIESYTNCTFTKIKIGEKRAAVPDNIIYNDKTLLVLKDKVKYLKLSIEQYMEKNGLDTAIIIHPIVDMPGDDINKILKGLPYITGSSLPAPTREKIAKIKPMGWVTTSPSLLFGSLRHSNRFYEEIEDIVDPVIYFLRPYAGFKMDNNYTLYSDARVIEADKSLYKNYKLVAFPEACREELEANKNCISLNDFIESVFASYKQYSEEFTRISQHISFWNKIYMELNYYENFYNNSKFKFAKEMQKHRNIAKLNLDKSIKKRSDFLNNNNLDKNALAVMEKIASSDNNMHGIKTVFDFYMEKYVTPYAPIISKMNTSWFHVSDVELDMFRYYLDGKVLTEQQEARKLAYTN